MFSSSSDAPIGFISGYYRVPGRLGREAALERDEGDMPVEARCWELRSPCRHAEGGRLHMEREGMTVTLLLTCAKDPRSC